MWSKVVDVDAASPELSAVVSGLVAELSGAARLPSRRAYWLRLAVDELVTNVAEHGYRGGGGPLRLDAGIDTDSLWVSIEDAAPHFDPLDAAATPAPPVAVGGHGLRLVRRHMDALEHAPVEGGNRVTVTMIRPGR